MSYKRSRATFEADNTNNTNNTPPQHAPYAFFGTPLPAYDPDARDDGSYVPVWKQEVTDERGRKRLHGAFTGGWSAGYFNTVGSKEGWAPSTFVSSRSNRNKDGNKKQEQKPEDFMDEEDLAEQAAAQTLETQGAFAGLGSTAESSGGGSKGMFADLFRTTGETIGVKLLQRMGWRQGQGVGPKVKRRVKGDSKGEMHFFAPENSRMVSFTRKTDRKGIGFAGEERLDNNAEDAGKDEVDDNDQDAAILHTNRSTLLAKPKKIKKASFGVGVLNDTGSDEDNEYDMGPKISYNRVIGGDKKKNKKKTGLLASNANTTVQTPAFRSKKLTQQTSTLSGFRKCHDGRLPLDDFVLTLTPLAISQENKYLPPTVPEGWTPTIPSPKSTEKQTPYQSTADLAKASTLHPKTRAALLGEQPLPGKSVFDFMSPSARTRLATATGKTNLPPALNEPAPAGFQTSEAEKRRTVWDLVPQLDKQVAAAALQRGSSGWMPYAEDEEKRARYRYFLELSAGLQSDLPERGRENFSREEWVKELREFKQAAEVFKPISGLMASRFTTSSSSAKLASDAPDPSSSAGSEKKKEEDPAERAAKMGMYGAMTRSRHPFFPTRLLCKRFNVKPPASVAVDPAGTAPDGDGDRESRRLDVVSQASLDRMMLEARFQPGVGGVVSGGMEGGEEGVENSYSYRGREEPAVVDFERNEALEGERARDEVFRDVFGGEEEER